MYWKRFVARSPYRQVSRPAEGGASGPKAIRTAAYGSIVRRSAPSQKIESMSYNRQIRSDRSGRLPLRRLRPGIRSAILATV